MANQSQSTSSKSAKEPLDKGVFDEWDFVVEANTRRNGDILIKNIPNLRLRGALDPSKTIVASPKQNAEDFEPIIPADQSRGLSTIPRTPGQRLYVNIKEKRYKVVDPLRDDESLRDRLASALRQKGLSVQKIAGVREQRGELSVDSMKSLCREIRDLLEDGHVKEVDGKEVPSRDKIDKLPGEYLLNPGSRFRNSQPRYEKDFEEWEQQLSRVGA